MKTELHLSRHHLLPYQQVVEIWNDGQFLGTVVGADGPGVRIISKYITNNNDAIIIRVDKPPVIEVKLEP